MREGILRLGNEQLARVGAAALSVREIARGLGVASSAIYRHVANRDELLTLLLVDAYDDLADAVLWCVDPTGAPDQGQDTNPDAVPVPDPASGASGVVGVDPGSLDAAQQFACIARGMRAWAVDHPARWALIYGSPVPGYAAPAELTTDPGTRVLGVVMRLLASGERLTGAPAGECAAPLSGELRALLAAGAAEVGVAASPERAAAALGAWADLIGRISAEVFEQFGPDYAAHGAELLDRWIASICDSFGLGTDGRRNER